MGSLTVIIVDDNELAKDYLDKQRKTREYNNNEEEHDPSDDKHLEQ